MIFILQSIFCDKMGLMRWQVLLAERFIYSFEMARRIYFSLFRRHPAARSLIIRSATAGPGQRHGQALVPGYLVMAALFRATRLSRRNTAETSATLVPGDFMRQCKRQLPPLPAAVLTPFS